MQLMKPLHPLPQLRSTSERSATSHPLWYTTSAQILDFDTPKLIRSAERGNSTDRLRSVEGPSSPASLATPGSPARQPSAVSLYTGFERRNVRVSLVMKVIV
jgi:hypothetical protein